MGRVDVRLVEEPDVDLGPENTPHGFVNGRFRHAARAHFFGDVLDVKLAHHVHVDAGKKRLASGFRAVRGYAVSDQLLNARPIGRHEALESPLLPKHIGQEPWIGG